MKPNKKIVDTGATLYDVNKQLADNLTPYNDMEIAGKQSAVSRWFTENCQRYAMLLCNDRRDFTIFHGNFNDVLAADTAAAQFIGCLIDRGDILAIDATKDGAWEVWLRINGKNYCYYLFVYDSAVIECGD